MKFINKLSDMFKSKKKSYTLEQLLNFSQFGGLPVTISRAYEKSLYVYRCINFIAEKSGEVPVYIRNIKTDEFVDMQITKNPNPEQNFVEFTEQVSGCLELFGNAFIVKLQEGEYIELHVLNPSAVTVVKSAYNKVIGYEYSGVGEYVKYKKEQVLHMKKLDFFSIDKKAISPIKPIETKIKIESSIEEWNENTFNQNLRPSAIITTDESLNDDEFKRVKKSINAHTESKNDRKPIFIDGGNFDYKQISVNPSEMDFIEAKKMNREDICVAFGVPPILLGLMDKTSYNNMSEARIIFSENKIVTFLNKFTKALTEFVFVDSDFKFYFDLQATPVFDEMRRKKSDEAKNYWHMGVPFSVINDHLELGFPDFPKNDVGYLPMGLMPANMKKKTDNFHTKYLNLKTPEARTMQKKFMDTEFNKIENINARIMKSALDEAFKQIDENEITATYEHDFTEIFRKAIETILSNTIEYFAKQLANVINEAELKTKRFEYQYNFNMFDPIISSYIKDESLRQGAFLNSFTNARMKTVITSGFQEGLSINQISANLKKDFVFSKARATRIARTETTSAANYGLEQSAKQSKLIEKKEWLSAQDEVVRESHILADGEKIGLDDTFSNGLKRPGDPDADAAEIVNCRCSLSFDI